MSSVFGTSVEQYSAFSSQLQIVGVNTEAAGRTLERLQRKAERSGLRALAPLP